MSLRAYLLRAVLPGVLLVVVVPVQAAGTAFTYQGVLEVAGVPASSYDFEATLFDTACSVEPCAGIVVGRGLRQRSRPVGWR